MGRCPSQSCWFAGLRKRLFQTELGKTRRGLAYRPARAAMRKTIRASTGPNTAPKPRPRKAGIFKAPARAKRPYQTTASLAPLSADVNRRHTPAHGNRRGVFLFVLHVRIICMIQPRRVGHRPPHQKTRKCDLKPHHVRVYPIVHCTF